MAEIPSLAHAAKCQGKLHLTCVLASSNCLDFNAAMLPKESDTLVSAPRPPSKNQILFYSSPSVALMCTLNRKYLENENMDIHHWSPYPECSLVSSATQPAWYPQRTGQRSRLLSALARKANENWRIWFKSYPTPHTKYIYIYITNYQPQTTSKSPTTQLWRLAFSQKDHWPPYSLKMASEAGICMYDNICIGEALRDWLVAWHVW